MERVRKRERARRGQDENKKWSMKRKEEHRHNGMKGRKCRIKSSGLKKNRHKRNKLQKRRDGKVNKRRERRMRLNLEVK